MVLPFLRFHLKSARKVSLRRARAARKRDEAFSRQQDFDDPLLLYTRYGDFLITQTILHSIKTFMPSVYSRLHPVTCMTLRALFATSMLHKFCSGTMGGNMSEDRFLELVAKQMNVSVKQLCATYASWFLQVFSDFVNLVTKQFKYLLKEITDNDYEDDEYRGQGLCLHFEPLFWRKGCSEMTIVLFLELFNWSGK